MRCTNLQHEERSSKRVAAGPRTAVRKWRGRLRAAKNPAQSMRAHAVVLRSNNNGLVGAAGPWSPIQNDDSDEAMVTKPVPEVDAVQTEVPIDANECQNEPDAFQEEATSAEDIPRRRWKLLCVLFMLSTLAQSFKPSGSFLPRYLTEIKKLSLREQNHYVFPIRAYSTFGFMVPMIVLAEFVIGQSPSASYAKSGGSDARTQGTSGHFSSVSPRVSLNKFCCSTGMASLKYAYRRDCAVWRRQPELCMG